MWLYNEGHGDEAVGYLFVRFGGVVQVVPKSCAVGMRESTVRSDGQDQDTATVMS